MYRISQSLCQNTVLTYYAITNVHAQTISNYFFKRQLHIGLRSVSYSDVIRCPIFFLSWSIPWLARRETSGSTRVGY